MDDMSDDDPADDGLEARLRWIAERVGRSIEDLRELDIDVIARLAGIEPERAQELLQDAEQWLSTRTGSLVEEAVARLSDLTGGLVNARQGPAGTGPHPLDLPTAEQGRALSAIDSGRWTVEPGSHELSGSQDGPAPSDTVGLVGELRARDWISSDGSLTLVGRDALRRWVEHA